MQDGRTHIAIFARALQRHGLLRLAACDTVGTTPNALNEGKHPEEATEWCPLGNRRYAVDGPPGNGRASSGLVNRSTPGRDNEYRPPPDR
jgi:hypothetical protein